MQGHSYLKEFDWVSRVNMIELPKQMQMNLGPTAGATVEEERQVGILGSKMGDYREQPPEQRQGKAIEGITHLGSVPNLLVGGGDSARSCLH